MDGRVSYHEWVEDYIVSYYIPSGQQTSRSMFHHEGMEDKGSPGAQQSGNDNISCLKVAINRYYEYGHIVRTLVYNIDDVNKLGAVYLKELLTCISHCIEEQEHQEDD